MDQVLKVWTTCEATVEERWVLRTSSDVSFDGDGCSILDLLDTDAVQVLAIENLGVHSERERRVTRVELERLGHGADAASEACSLSSMPSGGTPDLTHSHPPGVPEDLDDVPPPAFSTNPLEPGSAEASHPFSQLREV